MSDIRIVLRLGVSGVCNIGVFFLGMRRGPELPVWPCLYMGCVFQLPASSCPFIAFIV